MGTTWYVVAAALGVACTLAATAADRGLSFTGTVAPPLEEVSYLPKVAYSLWKSDGTVYHHVWPPMKFGWEIVLGSFFGFLGAALGSIGGVGGGGIFVPMLTLIIGFDPKSSAAMSKCMIMGAAVSTVYCNLKVKHPTLDMPVIDYDLALLIQPMLMLGVSIGVICNVVFPDWLVTVLLIILCIVTSAKAFLKGVETWKKETIIKREADKQSEQTSEEQEYMPLSAGYDATSQTEPLPVHDRHRNTETPSDEAVSIQKNVYWKELGLLAFVWVAFLALQVTKNYTATCSTWYWVLNLLQIPVSAGVAMYEVVGLLQGKRVISSNTNEQSRLKARQLLVYCFLGVTAGVVAGMLGVGGGSIMGPLFLELGVPPQVIFLFVHVKNLPFDHGLKCYSHLCNDVFVFHVRHRILPPEPVPCTICSILHYTGIFGCNSWPTLSKEADQAVRAGVTYHLHFVLYDLHQRAFSRWGWHLQHDSQDRAEGVRGIREHLQI